MGPAPFIPPGTVFKKIHGRYGYIVSRSFIRANRLMVEGRRRHDAKTETFAFADIEVIDVPCIDHLAALARLDQMAAERTAADPFAAYWAGSASASVMAHYRRGAVLGVAAGVAQ